MMLKKLVRGLVVSAMAGLMFVSAPTITAEARGDGWFTIERIPDTEDIYRLTWDVGTPDFCGDYDDVTTLVWKIDDTTAGHISRLNGAYEVCHSMYGDHIGVQSIDIYVPDLNGDVVRLSMGCNRYYAEVGTVSEEELLENPVNLESAYLGVEHSFYIESNTNFARF